MGRPKKRRAAAPPAAAVAEPLAQPSRQGVRVLAAALVLSLGAAGLAAFLSWHLFSGLPRVGDEVSYAFQGKLLAAGRLTLSPPAVPEAFRVDNVVLDASRWCSKYPPGFPLLLVPGYWAGAPWLVNPLLLGLATLGLFRLGSRLYGPAVALAGAFLFATLPFALLQGASFMSHTPTLATAVWALALVADGEGPRERPRLLGAGLLAGLCFLVRPVSAVLLLAAPGSLLLQRFPRGRRLRAALLVVAGGLVPLAFLLWVQWRSFGSPLRSGYAAFDPAEGFLGNRHGHGRLARIVRGNLVWYGETLPEALWRLPGPAFAWLALLLLRPRREDLPAVAAAGLLSAGYLAYYWRDLVYGGPRFLLETTGFLALLLARGLENLAVVANRLLGRLAQPRTVPVPLLLAVAALAIAGVTGVEAAPRVRAHGRAYYGVPDRPFEGAREAGLGPDALVLVDFRDPRVSLGYTAADAPAYSPYFLENALDPASGRRVFARALPGREAELARAYPRAETWRVVVSLSAPTAEETPVNGPSVFFGLSWERLSPRR